MEGYSDNLKIALVLIEWHLPNCDWQGKTEGNNVSDRISVAFLGNMNEKRSERYKSHTEQSKCFSKVCTVCVIMYFLPINAHKCHAY